MDSCCQDGTCPASRHQCQTQARRPRALRRLVAPSEVSEPDLRVPPLGQHRGFWTTSSQQHLDRVRSSTADRFGTSVSHAFASDSTPILDRAAVERATVVLAVARAQPSLCFLYPAETEEASELLSLPVASPSRWVHGCGARASCYLGRCVGSACRPHSAH